MPAGDNYPFGVNAKSRPKNNEWAARRALCPSSEYLGQDCH
jgi:hypothetical protein